MQNSETILNNEIHVIFSTVRPNRQSGISYVRFRAWTNDASLLWSFCVYYCPSVMGALFKYIQCCRVNSAAILSSLWE